MYFVWRFVDDCSQILLCTRILVLLVYIYIKSTFAANYKHLSYKYKICQDDWFIDIKLLIAKMKAQFEKETKNISTAHTIVELCAIRDGVANCDVMSCTDASKMIDLIFLD